MAKATRTNKQRTEAKTCISDLISKIDMSAENFEFPGWECGQVKAIVGAMRASGFTSTTGVALVIEQVGFSLQEGVIQCLNFCVATFPLTTFVLAGEAVLVNVRSHGTGKFPISFGQVQVTSREKTFDVPFEREVLISKGYLDSSVKQPTAEALLLTICDTLPRERLFCEAEFLKKAFGMPDDAKLLFVVEEWQHPSFNQLYGDEPFNPSSMPDLITMAEALCSGNASPKLAGMPNTSWAAQCESSS
jgi:uncharacterized protein DUF7003